MYFNINPLLCLYKTIIILDSISKIQRMSQLTAKRLFKENEDTSKRSILKKKENE